MWGNMKTKNSRQHEYPSKCDAMTKVVTFSINTKGTQTSIKTCEERECGKYDAIPYIVRYNIKKDKTNYDFLFSCPKEVLLQGR